MATWNELARDNRHAAYEGFRNERWRTSASRAYYAVYSATTQALLVRRVTMPAGRGNPSHARMPHLVGSNLTNLSHPVRWRLSGIVFKLYSMRPMADHMPQTVFERDEARICLGLMKQAFDYLEATP